MALRVITFAFILAVAVPALAQPRIELSPDTLDFGVVTPRPFVESTVSILNRGSDTLRIQKVETSCGCITATPDAGRIAFMETANMHVSMNIEHQSGLFVESVVLYTNDPVRPRVSLTCRVRITTPDSDLPK